VNCKSIKLRKRKENKKYMKKYNLGEKNEWQGKKDIAK
jgi:hypothetical protein